MKIYLAAFRINKRQVCNSFVTMCVFGEGIKYSFVDEPCIFKMLIARMCPSRIHGRFVNGFRDRGKRFPEAACDTSCDVRAHIGVLVNSGTAVSVGCQPLMAVHFE